VGDNAWSLNWKWKNEDMAMGTWMQGADVEFLNVRGARRAGGLLVVLRHPLTAHTAPLAARTPRRTGTSRF
jgi:hypothetical protein